MADIFQPLTLKNVGADLRIAFGRQAAVFLFVSRRFFQIFKKLTDS